MNLYELQDKENLSVRSFKVCLTNKLQSLDAIKAYYSQYRTFLNLRHCGAKSNLELIDLCRKNLDKEEYELRVSDEKPLSLYELRDEENLSVRSFNVCQAYNLQDLDAIKSYYSQHKTFLNLSNCGKKSNLELLDICFKYQNRVDNSEAPKRQNPFRIKIDDPFLSKYEQNLKWSKSTVEICKANKLSNLGLVLNHFEEKQTFGTLENIENNTVSELEAICKAFDQKTVGFKFWQSEIPEKEGLKSIEPERTDTKYRLLKSSES